MEGSFFDTGYYEGGEVERMTNDVRLDLSGFTNVSLSDFSSSNTPLSGDTTISTYTFDTMGVIKIRFESRCEDSKGLANGEKGALGSVYTTAQLYDKNNVLIESLGSWSNPSGNNQFTPYYVRNVQPGDYVKVTGVYGYVGDKSHGRRFAIAHGTYVRFQ